MRKLVVSILSAFIISIFFTLNLSAEQRGVRIMATSGQSFYLYKDYHALVVGVSEYNKWPDLPNAIKDAREVASTLEKLGFEIELLLNPTSNQLNATLNNMAFTLGSEKNRALLFYFAGHGETLELADGTELGYIIPSDCPLKRQDPIKFDDKAISMKEIEALSLKVKSKHFLMMFDSCFSGSLFDLVRAAPVDITEKSTRPVRQFITAGGAGEQVPDRSVFKIVFLDGIRGDADLNSDSYVTGSELGMHLQSKVVNYTRGGQHPQYGKINNPKLDKGDFIFVPSRKLQAGSRKTEEKLSKVSEEKGSLEKELQRLRVEIEKIKESRDKQAKNKRLASIPKKVTDAKIYKVTLRDIPKELVQSDIKKMVEKHNFFVKDLNEDGDFPNVFVDNGDETITDQATGLMWEKGGSSSTIHFWKAKKYVSQLNREKFVGKNDWRIPTLEELCSLLEQKVNERGQYIGSFFKDTQSKCLSADRFLGGGSTYSAFCFPNNFVNFSKGEIDSTGTENIAQTVCQSVYYYIRAVRSIK
jgi:uncharacterized caspase-like protein